MHPIFSLWLAVFYYSLKNVLLVLEYSEKWCNVFISRKEKFLWCSKHNACILYFAGVYSLER